MRRPNDTPRRVLIVLVVLVVLTGLMPAGVVKSVAHIPRQFFNPLLRTPALGLSRAMRDPSQMPPLDPATDLGNEAFRKLELLEAEAANAYLRLRVAELEKLVEDLGMISGVLQGTSYRVLRADGLQIRRDRQRPQLTINRGSKDGVRKGDVVVGESVLQLVGIVDQVDRATCQIDLINAEDRSLQVEIVPPIASTNASTMQTLWVAWDEEVGAFVTGLPGWCGRPCVCAWRQSARIRAGVCDRTSRGSGSFARPPGPSIAGGDPSVDAARQDHAGQCACPG